MKEKKEEQKRTWRDRVTGILFYAERWGPIEEVKFKVTSERWERAIHAVS